MNSTSRSSSALLLLALGCAPPPLAGRNLVVISIDTMRADRLGRLGADGQSLTPALDAFSATALAFSQAYSPSNETLFSHAGIFLGEAPSAWGPLDYGTFRLRPDAPTLASHLAQAGWRTEAVVAGGHMAPVFGIDDPRTSKRINFVGGIRGTAELEKLVDSGEHACAFSMFPTSIEDLMSIADAGGIMPPKSTWFEPKLRDAMFCHML